MAGAQHLPNDPDLALQTAYEFAQLNGAEQGECDFQLGASNCSISGQADRQVTLHFARIFHQDFGRVEARAAAKVAPISSATGIVPFGVLEDNFEFGEIVTLKEAAGENEYAGWFGALRLTGNGAQDYKNHIINGYDGQVSIGDIIELEYGGMSGPTEEGIEHRIEQCDHSPGCTVNSFQEGCSRVLMVPIVNIQAINNGGRYGQKAGSCARRYFAMVIQSKAPGQTGACGANSKTESLYHVKKPLNQRVSPLHRLNRGLFQY